jgi:hypothetical protein
LLLEGPAVPEVIPCCYILWILLTLISFNRGGAAVGTALLLLGGWMLLPTASYARWALLAGRPNSITGVALHSPALVNKATVLGFAGLLSLAAFGRAQLRQLRFSRWDLPVAAWCVLPGVSAIANALPVGQALEQVLYQTLVWGSPYLLGRAFLARDEDLLTFLRAVVLAGAIYVPVCLLEGYYGPFLYSLCYGWHPFEYDGARRYAGYRPLGLLEHGNQLGMWMAGSALCATGLARAGLPRRLPRLTPAVLTAVTCLCQSLGSIILLAVGTVLILLRRRAAVRALFAATLLLLVGYVAVRATGVVSLRRIVTETKLGARAKDLLYATGRGSLGWRMQLEELHLDRAVVNPFFGRAVWNWWNPAVKSRPWGLWLLVFGRYGLAGLFLLPALLLLPVVGLANRGGSPDALGLLVSTLLLITAADALLNSTILVPLCALCGATASRLRPAPGRGIAPGGAP